MQKEQVTRHSQALEREMHMMIYGTGGIPFLCFPTQDSLCHSGSESNEQTWKMYKKRFACCSIQS